MTRVSTARASGARPNSMSKRGDFGDEEEGDEEGDGGDGGGGEHPAPARGAEEGERPVDEVGEQDAGDDGHLVERDEAAADAVRGDLGDVEGGEDGGDADGDAADEARGDELVERARQGGADGGDGEQDGGERSGCGGVRSGR